MHRNQLNLSPAWTRLDGVFFGVCEGIGRRMQIDPWLIRIAWVLSFFALGFGLLAYVVLACTLPRRESLVRAQQPKILGVCMRLSEHLDLDLGLIRAATVLLAISSFGMTILAYLLLHFVMPQTAVELPAMRRVNES